MIFNLITIPKVFSPLDQSASDYPSDWLRVPFDFLQIRKIMTHSAGAISTEPGAANKSYSDHGEVLDRSSFSSDVSSLEIFSLQIAVFYDKTGATPVLRKVFP